VQEQRAARTWSAGQAPGEKQVAVSGADVGQQLLQAGLLDEISVHLRFGVRS
jgi:hypothetical protein